MQAGIGASENATEFGARLARYWVLLVLLVAAAAFLPALGAGTFYKEEGRRVAQAISILHGGSWWLMDTFGAPYFNKPPMLPWLIAISARLIGEANEVATRLPAFLAVTGGALLAGLLAGRMSTVRPTVAALFAALFYLATYNVDVHATRGITDGPAAFFAAAAFTIWALARLKGPIGIPAWVAITLVFTAGLLTKGPIPLLFPLIPMALIPLRERRFREFAILLVCFAASAIPLGIWLVINANLVSVDYLVTQMRIRRGGPSDFSLLDNIGHVLRNLAEGLLRSLPVSAAGAAWVWRNRSWRLSSVGWLEHALFIYAVPVGLFVLLWPQSGGRYVLPAAWPLAVLSGLWGAWLWERRPTRILLAAMTALLLVVQTATVIVADRQPRQIALRKEAVALEQAFSDLPAGRVLLVSNRNIFNRFDYVQRPIQLVSPEQMPCPPEGPFLLTESPWREAIDPVAWTKLRDIDGGRVSVFARGNTVSAACPTGIGNEAGQAVGGD